MNLEIVISGMRANDNPQESPKPSTALGLVLTQTKIESLIGQLTATQPNTKAEKELIENGTRMVFDIHFNEKAGAFERIVVSVTEHALAFIGRRGQYIRLNGQDLQNADKITESLAYTYTHPQMCTFRKP